jgi:hypothetical protein
MMFENQNRINTDSGKKNLPVLLSGSWRIAIQGPGFDAAFRGSTLQFALRKMSGTKPLSVTYCIA